MAYRADIDGLRAVAVLLVLAFHFQLSSLTSAGFVGVDVFYVISGYLIFTILWNDIEKKRFSLLHFYARRVRRLAPALIAVQLLALAAASAFLLPFETLSLSKEIFFVQVYASNIYYWRTLNYFGLHTGDAFMLHCWSLAVEEQFYLIFPVILLAVHRFARNFLLPLLILLCLSSFCLNLVMIIDKPQATFYLLPTRAWEMALGACAALVTPSFARSPVKRRSAALSAITLLLLTLALFRPSISFPGWFALLPTSAAALAILSGSGNSSFLTRILSQPVLVWIGRISYPLYLVHWPMHVFGSQLLPSYSIAVRGGLFACSFVLAWLIYHFVERPFRTSPELRSDRRVLTCYAIAVAAVLSILASIWLSQGWRGRFNPTILRISDGATDIDTGEQALDFDGDDQLNQRLTRVGAASATPHWLIFGDSHAGALSKAVSLWLARRGEAGVLAFHSGCLPVLNSGDALCRRFTRNVTHYVRIHRNIGNVLLVSIWRQPIEPGYVDQTGHDVEGKQAIVAFDQSLHATLGALHQIGVRTFLWGPLPAMPTSVPQTMARNLLFGMNRPTSISLTEHRHTFDFLHQAIDRDAQLIAGTADPAIDLCFGGTCPGYWNGRPLYWDNNHLAASQSPVVASILWRQMRAVPAAEARR